MILADHGALDGLTYRVDGKLAPLLVLRLDGSGESVYFADHVFFYRDPSVDMKPRVTRGAVRRMAGGMAVALMYASGKWALAIGALRIGQIVGIHLKPGELVDIQKEHFIAATADVTYSPVRVRGVRRMVFGGSGVFYDRFTAAPDRPGIVWVHAYGEVSTRELAEGEALDVTNRGWLAREQGVGMDTVFLRPATGLLGGNALTVTRFTGPGRLAIQSLTPGMDGEGGGAGWLGRLVSFLSGDLVGLVLTLLGLG